MVHIYTGTPGSGKSLHCAQDILFKVNRGQRVIANFPINIDMLKKKRRDLFYYVPDEELNPEYLFNFAVSNHKEKKEGQTLLVIDEAQRTFPIDRKYPLRKEWEQFFQLHRHYGFNIILCTQNVSYINKGIRVQAEYESKHRKLNNYNFFGMILGWLCGGSLFVCLDYWIGAPRKPVSNRYFRYTKKYGNLYDTFSNFSTIYNTREIHEEAASEKIENEFFDEEDNEKDIESIKDIIEEVLDESYVDIFDDDDFDFEDISDDFKYCDWKKVI